MKKGIALLLAGIMLLSLAGCGKTQSDTGSSPESSAPTTEPTTESTTEAPVPSIGSALEILETVWASYADAEKFPAAGGDFSEENSNMEGPGKYALDNTDALDSVLGLPADAAALVDDAASLMHMMNANTFTCGAFHVANADDVSTVVSMLKDNIMARQWMCGFPDRLVIVTVGDYVISYFGHDEVLTTFTEKLTAAYEGAVVACEESLL